MANLTFYYGTMGSGKTMALLMGAYNLENTNKKVYVIKSYIDTKAGDKLQTRIGIERQVDLLLGEKESLVLHFEEWKQQEIDCIFVDEAQFLSAQQAVELWYFTKKYDIPVKCYGLKSQFDLHFFTGSGPIMEVADSIVELQTKALCTCCGEEATINARYKDGVIELPGAPRIIIDGEKGYDYKPLCGNCYMEEVERVTGQDFLEIQAQKVKKMKYK